MIYIGICDDEKCFREAIHEMICKCVFQYDDITFSYFSSGAEVIEAIENKKFNCELLFLDINMPETNGLQTAAFIRENRIDVDIIFVTVSSEHVFDGYTYRAFTYLLKPLNVTRLSDELGRYMKLRENCSKCLYVNVGGKKVQIFLERVKYFAAEGRKILVIQKGEKELLSFYAKMGDLQETLQDDDFLRCHQSYLVNAKYIQSFSRTEINLSDEAIPVSRRYVEDVRNYFQNKSGEDRS